MWRSGGRGEPSKHFPVHFSSTGLNWAPLLSSFLSSTSLFPTRLLDRSSAPSRVLTPPILQISPSVTPSCSPAGFPGSAPSRRALPRHLSCCFSQLRRGPLVTSPHRSPWSRLGERRCLICRRDRGQPVAPLRGSGLRGAVQVGPGSRNIDFK